MILEYPTGCRSVITGAGTVYLWTSIAMFHVGNFLLVVGRIFFLFTSFNIFLSLYMFINRSYGEVACPVCKVFLHIHTRIFPQERVGTRESLPLCVVSLYSVHSLGDFLLSNTITNLMFVNISY